MATAAATKPANSSVGVIQKIASGLGLDVNLALATAIVESGLNPQAVGDGGTSFGLYQLHQGGELGSLTPQQAYNPTTNATVALTHMAAVSKLYPGQDPGQIAAIAQGPQNKAAYASAVDNVYAQLNSGVSPSAISGSTTSSGQSATLTAANTTSSDCGLSGGIKTPGILGSVGSVTLLNGCQLKALKGGLIVLAGGVLLVTGVVLIVAKTGIGGKVVDATGAGFVASKVTSRFGGSSKMAVADDPLPTPDRQIPARAKSTRTVDNDVNYSGGKPKGKATIHADDPAF